MTNEYLEGDLLSATETPTSTNNVWPCAVTILICCLTFLGICFAGVYLLIHWPW